MTKQIRKAEAAIRRGQSYGAERLRWMACPMLISRNRNRSAASGRSARRAYGVSAAGIRRYFERARPRRLSQDWASFAPPLWLPSI